MLASLAQGWRTANIQLLASYCMRIPWIPGDVLLNTRLQKAGTWIEYYVSWLPALGVGGRPRSNLSVVLLHRGTMEV